MTIEQCSPSVTPKRATDGIDAKHGKAKPADGTGTPADAVSFLSLLTSFGAEEGSDFTDLTGDALTTATPVLPGSVPQGQLPADANVAAQAASALSPAPAAGVGQSGVAPDAGAAAVPPGRLNPGQLMQGMPGANGLAKNGDQVLREPGVLTDAQGAALGNPGQEGGEKGLQMAEDRLQAAEDKLQAAENGLPGQKPGAFGRTVAARAVAAAMAERLERAEKTTSRVVMADVTAVKSNGIASGVLAESRSAAGSGIPELKVRDAVITLEGAVVAANPGGSGESVGSQGEKHASDKQNDSAAKVSGDGAWAGSAAPEGVAHDFSAVMADGSMLPVEQEVAERVRYWVSNEVQNAELTLDGAGKDPVEVSISLNGSEARVEFRTDREEMRQVLEDASSRLKDMLASEGLVLTGMSVGTSGSDNAGARGHLPPREGGRQAVVAASVPVAAGERARPASGVGRALDVFA